MKQFIIFFILLLPNFVKAGDSLQILSLFNDVTVTIDFPQHFSASGPVLLILYALPNGNTTAQTMGKKLEQGDDWHFDIQHIRAQTNFVRKVMNDKSIVVAYLENQYLSWPAWKRKNTDASLRAAKILDTLRNLFDSKNTTICLNGHSGGGSYIFSLLDAFQKIPDDIHRIAFLDSDYGYDHHYGDKIREWLRSGSNHSLQVFAYEDSLVEYQGKRIVSDTGGTWYRTHLMMQDIGRDFRLTLTRNDSIKSWQSSDRRIGFFLKPNPEKKIYHTIQVERNGFIHSVLAGTIYESKGYRYFGARAYRPQ